MKNMHSDRHRHTYGQICVQFINGQTHIEKEFFQGDTDMKYRSIDLSLDLLMLICMNKFL